jgi:hypothetical protein
LKHPPLVLFNLAIDPQGQVQFNANLAHYTQLFVVAVDQNSVAQRQVDLADKPSELAKRDLSLAQSLSTGAEDKGFTESRTTTELSKDDTHTIEDITSTEI